MSLDKLKLTKLQTLEDIQNATDSIKKTSTDKSNVDINIFSGMTSDEFSKLVDKSSSEKASDSIFYQNIKDIGTDDVFSAIDTNNDGKLDDNELSKVAGLDSDKKGFSTQELKVVLHDVISKALDALNIEAPNVEDALNATLPTGNDYYNMPASGGYSAPSGSSANQVYGNNGTSGASSTEGSDATDGNKYSGMNLEELKSEKSTVENDIKTAESEVKTAKTDVETKQKALETAEKEYEDIEKQMNGKDSALSKAVEADNTIDSTKKEEFAKTDKEIAENDKKKTENDKAISEKESAISENDSNLDKARTDIADKDSSIADLESAVSKLNSQKSDSKEGSDKESATAELTQKQAALAQAKQEREELVKKRDELTKKQETLKSELDKLKETQKTIETEKNNLLSEKQKSATSLALNSTNPLTQTAIKNFNDIKAKYDKAQEAKNTAQSDLDKAKETLETSQTKLDEKKDALNDINTQITKKESTTSSEELIENAKKYLGYNEANGSYKLFTNGRTEAWCADFVSYVAKETYGDKLPEGFGSASVSGLQEWGKNNGRTVGKNDVEAGQVMIQKNNGASHTGLVTSVERDSSGNITAVHTIEGNTSNTVAERTYHPGDSGYEKITSYVSIN
ncbi:MAG: CHAP domain-containing protein [Candidatus Gastranaerophilales bacterium]|nr:CHAP domain-containing protein [Candidatus Gastranaerophilales bacterium]